MCGICGIAGANARETGNDVVRRMVARIAHRGPDGQGVWVSDKHPVALGHARLAIVDISDAGAQPMHHRAGLHCTVNGEIYNYPELRRDLEREGAVFASHCDSEIVLHGYLAEGPAFFKKLNGMFAFALQDDLNGKLFLARDRAGIKPLYYCFRDGGIAFASEIKSLIAAYDVHEWAIDPVGLSQYMTYQTGIGSQTLFAGVFLLKPGHILSIDTGNIRPVASQPFWEPRENLKDISFDDAVSAYHDVFAKSVSRHLLSDVPVSSYISAGFDSASVATQAAHLSGPLTAFTGRFRDGGWYDETKIAAEGVAAFHGRHICVDIDAQDLSLHLDAVIDALDEPKMGMGAFPQYMVAKQAAEHFKVILTGHGGDELFSGYPVFKLNNPLLMRLSEAPHLAYFAMSSMQGLVSPEFGRYMPVLWSMHAQEKLTGQDVRALKPWAALENIQNPHENLTDRIYHTYLQAYLPGLLVVEDKISMAHAIESRTPMLDNAMLDLSLSIPQAVKLHGGKLKALIKQNARGLLPENFFHQPKRGFPTPLRNWLRGPLQNFMHERLTGSRLNTLFDTDVLAQVIDGYTQSSKRFVRPLDEIQSHRMWQLLSLEAWLRIWEEKYGITLRLP